LTVFRLYYWVIDFLGFGFMLWFYYGFWHFYTVVISSLRNSIEDFGVTTLKRLISCIEFFHEFQRVYMIRVLSLVRVSIKDFSVSICEILFLIARSFQRFQCVYLVGFMIQVAFGGDLSLMFFG
jgi:hypothetical protein